MIDYQKIKKICHQNSEISARVVDEFLLYYAAKQDKLEVVVNKELTKYKHIIQNEDPAWVNGLKAQYIGHGIFKKDGLIGKYLNHSALKYLGREERSYLEQQADTPWRFSFSVIVNEPGDDFFEMEDAFSEESFLLYSPGITRFLKEGDRLLWFNLIGFNGHCWQTYGPINGYRSFEPDDLYFFSTEISPSIKDETDIVNHIERYPIPYTMLLTGSEIPMIFNRNDQTVFNQAEYAAGTLGEIEAGNHFKVEHTDLVWKYSLKRWDEFPHFARFYHDRKKQKLFLASMTDRGFLKLSEALITMGIDITEYPDTRLSPSMLSTAQKILKKKIVLDPYEDLFTGDTSPEAQGELDKINSAIELILPDINSGKEPNLLRIARDTGADIGALNQIVAQMRKTIQAER